MTAARAALPKLKLKLPPPKTAFRAHLPSQTTKTVEPPHAAPLPEARPRARNVPKDEPREHARSEQPLELDSAARTAVLLAPPPHSVPVAPPPPSSPTQLIPHTVAAELLEKAAFWGDGTRGLARLRFNNRARAGLANATITLEHDGDAMHLRVEGVDDGDLEKLRERLAARGVTISGES